MYVCINYKVYQRCVRSELYFDNGKGKETFGAAGPAKQARNYAQGCVLQNSIRQCAGGAVVQAAHSLGTGISPLPRLRRQAWCGSALRNAPTFPFVNPGIMSYTGADLLQLQVRHRHFRIPRAPSRASAGPLQLRARQSTY